MPAVPILLRSVQVDESYCHTLENELIGIKSQKTGMPIPQDLLLIFLQKKYVRAEDSTQESRLPKCVVWVERWATKVLW